MKKYIIPFIVTSFILIVLPGQTNAPKAIRELTVTLPLDDWNALIFSANNRNIKGITVVVDEAIIKNVVGQLNEQLADTTKKK